MNADINSHHSVLSTDTRERWRRIQLPQQVCYPRLQDVKCAGTWPAEIILECKAARDAKVSSGAASTTPAPTAAPRVRTAE